MEDRAHFTKHRREQNEVQGQMTESSGSGNQAGGVPVRPASDYLAGLNPQQRRAVEYGIKPGNAKAAGPLLVIAGAGSGKTKTVAHRVAHLIVNGIDPHRILLLTFSRRAAKEMTDRVQRVASSALKMGKVDLPWAGTFHSVGARLLREYANQIGLKPSFTILDRSDAADLMNLVRHDLGQSKKDERFRGKTLASQSIHSRSIPERRSSGFFQVSSRGV